MTDEPLPPVHADAAAIAADLGIHPGTIHTWARQGRITSRGRDSVGRALYDLDECTTVADAATARAATFGGWAPGRAKMSTSS